MILYFYNCFFLSEEIVVEVVVFIFATCCSSESSRTGPDERGRHNCVSRIDWENGGVGLGGIEGTFFVFFFFLMCGDIMLNGGIVLRREERDSD